MGDVCDVGNACDVGPEDKRTVDVRYVCAFVPMPVSQRDGVSSAMFALPSGSRSRFCVQFRYALRPFLACSRVSVS